MPTARPRPSPGRPDAPPSRRRRSPRPSSLRPGSRCPRCGRGKLDYDGCLVLSCPACRYGEAGAPT
ncbi:MAG: hypothetical protein FJZ97_00620 [Chloroflexi bacterium]|nr:hypothetical protein [Chloroflexota bacterium]